MPINLLLTFCLIFEMKIVYLHKSEQTLDQRALCLQTLVVVFGVS